MLGLWVCCTGLWFGPKVFAQNVPPSQDIGAQAQQLQKKVEQIQKTVESKKAALEKASEEENLRKRQVIFMLKKMAVRGSSIFTEKELAGVYGPYLNKYVNFNDINNIITGIKGLYQQKGYLTTVVYFPQQEIKDGAVEIFIIEGKMGQLGVEGNRYFSTKFLARNIHLPHGTILNMNQLNRDLLWINKNGDLQAVSVIGPGKEPGTTDVIVKVQDKRTWHVGTSFDNNGSRILGKYRGGSYVRSTNATGHGDSLFINTLMNSRLLGQSVSYRTPVGTRGTQVGIDYSHFTMKLGKEFKSYDITGTTNQGSVEISQELYLAENMELSAAGGLSVKSITKHVLGQRVSDDQLRIPYMSMAWSESDAWGNTSVTPRLDFGTGGFLGASTRNHPSASRAGTGGFYVKYSQEISRTQKMLWDSYIRLSSQFSAASHTLPSSEQFQIGGEDSVRGYPEGDYSADVGGTFSVEWNFPMYLFPKQWKLPKDEVSLRNRIMPYVFMDAGVGSLKKVLPGERQQKSLMSLGGGFRARLYKSIFFNADWGVPVSDDPAAGSGPSTFHFSLQMEM